MEHLCFFFNFIYLFIYLWLHWVFVALHRLPLVGATVHCSARASHCSGFSCCGAQALGTLAVVCVAHGLSSCDMWALEFAGSVVVVHGLCCSLTCGVFPDQGSDSCPLHWQMDSLPLRGQRSPWSIFITPESFLRFASIFF